MKITHTDGTTVDTDTLPDMEAMVLEKVEEFRKFCCEHQIPFFMLIDPKGGERHTAFWNLRGRNTKCELNDNGKLEVDVIPMIRTIDIFITNFTNGDFFVAKKVIKQ